MQTSYSSCHYSFGVWPKLYRPMRTNQTDMVFVAACSILFPDANLHMAVDPFILRQLLSGATIARFPLQHFAHETQESLSLHTPLEGSFPFLKRNLIGQ